MCSAGERGWDISERGSRCKVGAMLVSKEDFMLGVKQKGGRSGNLKV